MRSYPRAAARATHPRKTDTHVNSRPFLAIALLLSLASGCRGGADPGISQERFIAANVALRTLPQGATDEQRTEVLERYRVTADDLRRWVDARAGRPEALAEAWREVAERLDSLAAMEELGEAEGGVAGGPPPPPVMDDTIRPRPGVKDFPYRLPGRPGTVEIPGGESLHVDRPVDRPGVDRTAPPMVIEPAPPR